MKFHTLKAWPPYFREVRDDLKLLEIRSNDRDYREGDVLVLQEYLPTDDELHGAPFDSTRTQEAILELEGMDRGFTGDVEICIAQAITWEAPGLEPGYVAISLRRCVLAAPEAGEDGPGPNEK